MFESSPYISGCSKLYSSVFFSLIKQLSVNQIRIIYKYFRIFMLSETIEWFKNGTVFVYLKIHILVK